MSGIIEAANLQVDNIKSSGGTSAMTIDSSGRILTPARPSFLVRGYGSVSAGSQSINNITTNSNVGIMYDFDEVSHNIGSHFSNSTGKFTVPISGLYYISGGYGYKASTNWGHFTIFAQDGDHIDNGFLANYTPNDESAYSSHLAFVKQCTAGDEIACGFITGYSAPGSNTRYFHFGVTLIG